MTARIGDAVNQTLASLELDEEVRWIIGTVQSVVGAATNLHWYGINGKLDHLKFTEKDWKVILNGQSVKEDRKPKMMEVIEKIYEVGLNFF